MKKKNKGFTLIELISVLVILAILALIVTPLVLNIIRKARVSADKRSIDAYGRSIELAVASYLLDNGTFPTSVEQLTIEYSGDRVECETTKLNSDSSVYLASCTVAGRKVTGYTYGTEETIKYKTYSVGDKVTYNNVDYYVIADSDEIQSTVILLKAEPITSEEIANYLSSTEVESKVNTSGTYARMGYYSGATCTYSSSEGCTTDYEQSDIKYVVDIWKAVQAPQATETRLIKRDEYETMTTVETYETPTVIGTIYVPQYDWMYNSNYWYWTMSSVEDSDSDVWGVDTEGSFSSEPLRFSRNGTVRPVITILKSLLSS